MLTLSGIRKAYGGRVLFSDTTLQVNRQDRIGLVGPNGAGKSTLFSLILGEESADEGKIILERNVSLQNNFPFVRGFLAENEREERGLARAIRPDEANAILTVHLQRRV